MSRPARRNAFLRPPSVIRNPSVEPKQKQKRQANVYDAVAGRISSHGFLPKDPFPSKNRDTLSSSTVPVPPEEVLFRRKDAPERYEEDDFYWADRQLSCEQSLPDSDLLKAIHVYASDFYGRATIDKGLGDFESMNETALLAMGILLEEAIKHSLGENGDMVFVEAEDGENCMNGDGFLTAHSTSETVLHSNEASSATMEPDKTRKYKKRKLLSGKAE